MAGVIFVKKASSHEVDDAGTCGGSYAHNPIIQKVCDWDSHFDGVTFLPFSFCRTVNFTFFWLICFPNDALVLVWNTWVYCENKYKSTTNIDSTYSGVALDGWGQGAMV
ncbi:hypothetical protein AVEN_130171-1 [Araneus ventricosus]|uniref:Uncharacterized protein n=1 Tax=Araneus ventricosus TaxID=182803 RepID=A0A4Y2SFK2_ARAVE|nr:hypothetical protein AVEN_130171-1 [Araneus ventricosus]